MRGRAIARMLGAVIAAGACGCSFDASGVAGGGADASITPPIDAPQMVADAPRPPPPPDANLPPPIDARPPDITGVAHAQHMGGGINVDGDLSDWDGAKWYAFSASDPGAHLIKKAASYSPSVSVQFAARWSSSTLYFAFQITDDQLIIDSTALWNDDSVEIYLDPDNDGSGPYATDDHWIVFSPDSMCGRFDPGAAVTVTCAAGSPGGSNWFTEGSVDFSSLGISSMSGKHLGFGVGANDDDGITSNGANYDGYTAWYYAPGPGCSTCCPSDPAGEEVCDTTRPGELVPDP